MACFTIGSYIVFGMYRLFKAGMNRMNKNDAENQ